VNLIRVVPDEKAEELAYDEMVGCLVRFLFYAGVAAGSVMLCLGAPNPWDKPLAEVNLYEASNYGLKNLGLAAIMLGAMIQAFRPKKQYYRRWFKFGLIGLATFILWKGAAQQ